MPTPLWAFAPAGVACMFLVAAVAHAEPETVQDPSPKELAGEREFDPHSRGGLDASGLEKAEEMILKRLAAYLAPDDWRALSVKRKRQLLGYASARFEGRDPYAVCWAPGTPAPVVRAFHAVEEAAPVRGRNRREVPGAATQLGTRWGQTATNGSQQGTQGQPITLTWSIVPDGTAIPAAFADDTSNPSDFRAWIVGIYGGDASLPPDDPVNQVWFSFFEDMFASYAAKTGLRYVYEPNDDGVTLSSNNRGILGARGDIRIAAHEVDGDPQPGEGTTLAYNYFPDFGDMVIDSADSNFNNTVLDSRLFRNTIEHEHGHGIGLEHVCPLNETKLMEPNISLSFLGLQNDDIFSAQRHYGDSLEVHGSVRNNDSITDAAAIGLAPGSPFTFQWLSIDDNSDTDYLSFIASSGSQVTLRVVPGAGSYLEGAQNTDGTCSAGTSFNSTVQHDLTLELLAPDQSVLAVANATGAGGTEEILSALTTQSGTHYIRVTGDSSNALQLFRLESSLVLPGVAFVVQAQSIQLESLLPPNGVIDPGETVAYQIEISNLGTVPAQNVQGTLSGSSGFTGFTATHAYGSIAAAGSATGDYVFALSGAFGETIPFDLTLTADGGVSQVAPLSFRLGKPQFVLDETFDQGGGSLPAGWSSSTVNNGSGWSVVGSDSFSPPSSLFAADVGAKGLSVLTSPSLTAPGSTLALSFRQRYNTETGYDGGVLEVSVNGGGWADILSAGGVFVEGGYVARLAQGQQNPLPTRDAWTGSSGGWIRTEVTLPPSMLNTPLRFRWVLGSDRTGGGEGWYVDDVRLDSGLFEALGNPGADLVVADASAAEGDAGDTAEVRVTTPLPLIDPLAVPLLSGGSANPGSDLVAFGLPLPSIASGQVEESVTVAAVKDSEVEGPESFTLEIDPAAALVPGGNGTAVVTIADTPYGQWAFANLGLVPLNGPHDDLDDDHADNLTEYAWGTDGASFLSRPELNSRFEGGLFRVDAPFATLPSDVIMSAEGSFDLLNWSAAGIQSLADGFGVPESEERFFLRLAFEVAP